MSGAVNLVAGRLGLAITSGEPGPYAANRPVHYGVGRLGLVSPCRSAARRQPAVEPPSPNKKSSFKLPKPLIHWLKAYALTTGRYQYSVVAEALEHYLAEAGEQLNRREQANLAELESQYDQREPSAAAPVPVEPSAHQIGFDPEPQGSDPPDYGRDMPDPYATDACSDLCSIPALQKD